MTNLLALLLVGSTSITPVKVSVDGEGYLRFIHNGRVVFSKTATLTAVEGCLGANGAKLLPNIPLPEGLDDVKIDLMGNVVEGGAHLGRLVIAVFPKGANCTPEGNFLAFEDRPTLENPGEDTAGVIRTGDSSAKSAIAAESDPKPVVLTTGHTTAPTPSSTTTTKTASKTPSTSSGQVSIAIHEHSEVAGVPFSLGDIASITGPDDLVEKYKKIHIGETAVAGVTRYVDQRYICLKLLGAGHAAGTYAISSPDKAEVVRKTRTISADDIITFAVNAAQTKIGQKIPLKTTANVQSIVADDGEITLESSDPEQTSKGITVVITAREGNNIVGTRTVQLASSGQIASIKVGDTVTVVMRCGTASIEVTGKAISAGFVGEKIQVAVTATAGDAQAKTTTQTGVITDDGKVEVDL